MYKRRFNTKPLYVSDPDEPEPEAEPISETGPASPSCEDAKIEEPSPKKRFHFLFSIFEFLYFHGFSFIFGFVNWEVKVVNL